jgi:hypothetical protein
MTQTQLSPARALRTVRIVFHLGVFLAASALVVVVASAMIPTEVAWAERLRDLVTIETAIAYVMLSLVHMVVLSTAVRLCSEEWRSRAVGFLYTAGFVHTLLALGVSIAVGGAELLTSGTIDATSIGVVLFPMGAAVLPHAIGVWTGQDIEATLRPDGHAPPAADGTSRRANDAAEQRLSTERLQGLEKLEKEVRALNDQAGVWAQVRADIDEVGKTAKRMNDLMNNVTLAATRSDQALEQFRKTIETGTTALSVVEPELTKLGTTVKKIDGLIESVIDLLNSRLFQQNR